MTRKLRGGVGSVSSVVLVDIGLDIKPCTPSEFIAKMTMLSSEEFRL